MSDRDQPPFVRVPRTTGSSPADDANVSVFDWGFLYGDTLFETIRVHRGVPLLWTAHVRRLLAGCEALGYPDTPDAATLRSAVDQTLAAHDYDDAVVRVTVSRGRGTAGLDMRRTIDPTLVVLLDRMRRFTSLDGEELRVQRSFSRARGITTLIDEKVVTTSISSSPYARHSKRFRRSAARG